MVDVEIFRMKITMSLLKVLSFLAKQYTLCVSGQAPYSDGEYNKEKINSFILDLICEMGQYFTYNAQNPTIIKLIDWV